MYTDEMRHRQLCSGSPITARADRARSHRCLQAFKQAASPEAGHAGRLYEVRRHRVARKGRAVDGEYVQSVAGKHERESGPGAARADWRFLGVGILRIRNCGAPIPLSFAPHGLRPITAPFAAGASNQTVSMRRNPASSSHAEYSAGV
jgi:hypothetical protein